MGLTDRDIIELTPEGLYCRRGGFHIDPWKPVDRAVITHAPAAHYCAGCSRYLTSPTGALCLRARLGDGPAIDTLPWREPTRIGDATVTLFPAGHILGSAQVRIEPVPGSRPAPTTVVTGDHAAPSPHLLDGNGVQPDRADLLTSVGSATHAELFEPVPCDLFVTESTFGLPIFTWRDPAAIARDINGWWRANAEAGRTSVLFAYALGKTQRVLSLLDEAIGPSGLHGSALKTTRAYRDAGVALPKARHANAETAESLKGRGVVIAPGSADNTPWLRRFAGPEGMRSAYVSGWMTVRGRRRWRSADRGFALSDHADWPGLLASIDASGAARIGVTHGYDDHLARFLNETATREAFVIPTRFTGDTTGSGADDAPADDAPPAEQLSGGAAS